MTVNSNNMKTAIFAIKEFLKGTTCNLEMYKKSSVPEPDKSRTIKDLEKDKKEMLEAISILEKHETFVCKGCAHELQKSYSLRTPEYCFLCDPAISLQELQSEALIKSNQ